MSSARREDKLQAYKEELPLVSFGKYKGQPVTSLYADPKYLEWCKAQDWFEKKYSNIYNIVVNQTFANQLSKTPEHNRLQTLFLCDKNVMKFVNKIYPIQQHEKGTSVPSVEFEGKFNWDLIIRYISRFKCICRPEQDSLCSCIYKDTDDRDVYKANIYCEIKPTIGDDYPDVLRKMKKQIELTNSYLRGQKTEELKKLGYTEGQIGGYKYDDMKQIKGLRASETNGWNELFSSRYILLVGELTTHTISEEQLRTIFHQTRIDVLFIKDLDIISDSIVPTHTGEDEKVKRRREIEKQIADLQEELSCL